MFEELSPTRMACAAKIKMDPGFRRDDEPGRFRLDQCQLVLDAISAGVGNAQWFP